MNPLDYFDWQRVLKTARAHVRQGHFDACLAACEKITSICRDDVDALMAVGSLLSSSGYVTEARKCYQRVCALVPNDLRPMSGLANCARDSGDHAECRRLYEALLLRLSDVPAVRSSALMSLEYDPDGTAGELFAKAKQWGDWAIARAGGLRSRPVMRALHDRPLRVGYVSADFCQHTVGLFVKDVLRAHDSERVTAYAYSAGQVNDWVTAAVRDACVFRDVAALDDTTLAQQIRRDEIDVLVDLSGHTAGSRLTAFALRPAPVQISWLGYFATTGLPVIDAVLLDDWHAPPGTEAQFIEPIIRLPNRFCYAPVHFAPPHVVSPPCTTNGYVSFGCFNNTGKLNADVYALWARVLSEVPDSRLVLKWRTFQDRGMCQSVRNAFADLGIAPERIELRGASFHADLLKEYADIDIALDPFPFTGGLTSCEALWMGVPVVTWPQSRVVSRQTFAFLAAIGLSELAARDEADYVRIAVDLASDTGRLARLREGMRDRVKASALCDVQGFTRALEKALVKVAGDATGVQ